MNSGDKRERPASTQSESSPSSSQPSKKGKMDSPQVTPPSSPNTTGGNPIMPNTEVNVTQMFQQVLEGQTKVRRSLESKIDKLRNDFTIQLDVQLKAIRNDFSLELNRLQSDIERLGARLGVLENQNDGSIDTSGQHQAVHDVASGIRHRDTDLSVNNTEVTVIITGLHESFKHGLDQQVAELVDTLGLTTEVKIMQSVRLKPKITGRAGLVKVAFASRAEKIKVLRAKSELKNFPIYARVYLRSSKTHTERVLELNARTLLSQIPDGHKFRIAGNGRIVEKQQGQGPGPPGIKKSAELSFKSRTYSKVPDYTTQKPLIDLEGVPGPSSGHKPKVYKRSKTYNANSDEGCSKWDSQESGDDE